MAAAQPWSRISLKSSISLSHSAANRTAVCFAATLAVALIWLSPKTAESAACVAEVDSRATNEVIIFGAVLENLPSEGEVPPLRNGKLK